MFGPPSWGWADLASGRVADDRRPGFAHERNIQLYCSSYLAGVMWLSLRFSPLYPTGLLAPLDPALCAASITCYGYGLAGPVHTVGRHWDELTSTEQLRMKGMVVSGAIGCVFILETAALLVNGAGWWEAAAAAYPAQSLLEPSVTLFAAYAVEAGMLLHRFARRGVLTFAQVVPFFATVVLPVLTLLPMASLLCWKHEELSLWNFLFPALL